MEDPTPKKARAKRVAPLVTPLARTGTRTKANARDTRTKASPPADEPQPRITATKKAAPAKAAKKTTKTTQAAETTKAGETTQTATPPQAARTKKAPPRSARNAQQYQPILDEALLSHLEQVLADLDPPVVAAPPTNTAPPTNAARPTEPQTHREPQRTAPLWAKLVADPGYAAEHVIGDSVVRAGPQARDWVDRMRARYPHARPDALARLAASELTRVARHRGAGAAAAGPPGAVASVGAVARVQVRLVLTVAAVYGLDPTSEARTRDVLDLLRVPRLTQPTAAAVGNVGRLAAGVAVRRIAARLAPFGAAIAAAVHGGRSTEDLATRAIDRFRPGLHERKLEEPDLAT